MSSSFRGASAESLETLAQDLGAGAELAEDLFGVSAVLGEQPSLRRVLTDPSVIPGAKAGLVKRVFEGKVGAAALGLLERAAGLKWASTLDLGAALESLGVVALVRAAEQAGEADRLEADLFAIGRLVADNPGLRDALSDGSRSVADRRALIRGILDGRASASAVRLAEQAIAGSHHTVTGALEEYADAAASHRGRINGVVRVAAPLADADRTRLEVALAGQYGKPVTLNVLVDPAVIGGVKVELGDDVIDGTVASRLDDARRRLAG